MKQAEFVLLHKAGAFESVVIWPAKSPANGWVINAIGFEEDAPRAGYSWIEPAREHTPRAWASIDSAYKWLKENGWHGDVTISD